jgi:poly-gamma-glutamate synthesis protein (capsule biosynthesis protein)
MRFSTQYCEKTMLLDTIPRKIAILISALMIITGISLGIWTLVQMMPGDGWLTARATDGQALQEAQHAAAGSAAPVLENTADENVPDASVSDAETALNSAVPEANAAAPETAPRAPLPIAFSADVPATVRTAIAQANTLDVELEIVSSTTATPALTVDLATESSARTYTQFYAAATRFDTIDPTISWADVNALWRDTAPAPAAATAASPALRFQAVAVLTDTIPALESILGTASDAVQGYADVTAVQQAVRSETPTLALIPFDLLEPALLVLAIDGQNPVENAQNFDPDTYPLVATFHVHVAQPAPGQAQQIDATLDQLLTTNRDPSKLTVIAMTGVTAMVRGTAAQMDLLGDAWPAEVIGPELARADITHISNEVPFVPDCQTNTSPDNLVFCSKPSYMKTLEALGVDIIGLTGNHQNDYGVEGALASLAIYAEAGLPVYGGGKNKEAAFAPLYLENNGNRLAFLGANSYGPAFAWASDSRPGSAPFDLAILSATVRNIKAKGLADVVLVELQYQETYDVEPLIEQRMDFTALVRAGADVVTGVQSHVPQGIEFTEGKIVLYGLGNLFFDQMWSQSTRESLIPKHTIYDNRHISTQLLTTMLHDFGQPHWATPQERSQILSRVFAASYFE